MKIACYEDRRLILRTWTFVKTKFKGDGMENIRILLISDNREGKTIGQGFREMGADLLEITPDGLSSYENSNHEITVLVVNLDKSPYQQILDELSNSYKAEEWVKFVFVRSAQVKRLDYNEYSLDQLEFLQRPVRIAEFLLITEKTILAERFKRMLEKHSIKENGHENTIHKLFDVVRKKVFVEDVEGSGKVFEKIVNMQETLDLETMKYQNAIKKFSMAKQKNLFLDEPVKQSNLLESLKLSGSDNSFNEDLEEEILRLEEENRNLEEALIEAQQKIMELEQKVLG